MINLSNVHDVMGDELIVNGRPLETPYKLPFHPYYNIHRAGRT